MYSNLSLQVYSMFLQSVRITQCHVVLTTCVIEAGFALTKESSESSRNVNEDESSTAVARGFNETELKSNCHNTLIPFKPSACIQCLSLIHI